MPTCRPLFGNASDPVYDVLQYLDGGIFIDVGASDGGKAKEILQKSPQSHIIAVEPFPPNVEMLREEFSGDPRVTIIPKAVAAKQGVANLTVPSVVQSDGIRKKGYSSVGYLTAKADEKSAMNVSVPAITLQDVVPESQIRLLKIDVQGGEFAVLKGGEDLIKQQKFDTKYLIIPRTDNEPSDWERVNNKSFSLTNGMKAFFGWPKIHPKSPEEYVSMFKKQHQKIGYVQTDLIAVAPSFLIQFMDVAFKIRK